MIVSHPFGGCETSRPEGPMIVEPRRELNITTLRVDDCREATSRPEGPMTVEHPFGVLNITTLRVVEIFDYVYYASSRCEHCYFKNHYRRPDKNLHQ
jgi:hypothetical protein